MEGQKRTDRQKLERQKSRIGQIAKTLIFLESWDRLPSQLTEDKDKKAMTDMALNDLIEIKHTIEQLIEEEF